MPDPNPNPNPVSQSPSSPASAAPPPARRVPAISTAHEFGNAKRNLPPVRILLAAMGGVLIIAGVASLLQRPKPQAAGTIVYSTAVPIPNQNAVLAAFTFVLRNPGQKPLWIKGIQGKLATASGELTGDVVSAVDFDRYYQAFPTLSKNAEPALSPEDKLQPGQEVKRTVIVSFQVSLDAFNQSKSASIVIQPYDQPLPVTLTR